MVFFSSGELNIDFDDRISFENDNWKEFFNKFVKIYSGKKIKKVHFRLEESSFIYPSALIVLIKMTNELKRQGIKYNTVVKQLTPIHEYLQYSNAGKYLNIQLKSSNSKGDLMKAADIVKLQKYEKFKKTNVTANTLTGLIKGQQDLSIQVESYIAESIEELIMNIKQHSGYSCSYMIGQAYPTSNRIRIVISDNGIGIKEHITKGGYASKHNCFKEEVSEKDFARILKMPSSEAIMYAAKKYVSGTNYDSNSGEGLNFLIQSLCKTCNGVVTIISEDGMVQWKNGIVYSRYDLPYKVKGTVVCITIDSVPGTVLKFTREVLQ